MLDSLRQDLKFALRTLRRSPGFATLVVVTLALAVGANTAIFSLVDSVLLRSPWYDRHGRLISISTLWPNNGMPLRGSMSIPLYLDLLERSRSFDSLAIFETWRGTNFSAGEGEPEYVATARTTASLFDVLEAHAKIGRLLENRDNDPEAPPVAVISSALFQRRFGGDPAVLGTTIQLESEHPYTVVGVVPPEIDFPRGTELWVPYQFTPAQRSERGNHSSSVVGRVAASTRAESVATEITGVAAQLQADHPEAYPREWTLSTTPYRELEVGRARPVLLTLLGVVGAVLLIGCANVANLLLARSSQRRRELGVRGALGASRGQVLRQLLIESFLLAGSGGLLGCAAAAGVLGWLRASSAPGLAGPAWQEAGLDARILAFAAATTLFTAVLFGLAPALSATRLDLARGLRTSAADPARRRLLGGLVLGETALATVLVCAAGMLGHSLIELGRVDPGFHSTGLVSGRLMLRADEFPDRASVVTFFDRLLPELETRPEVDRAALVNLMPLGGVNTDRWLWVDGHAPLGGGDRLTAEYRIVSPDYFETLGIPLLAGRAFASGDGPDAPEVAIVSSEMAARFWPDRQALGGRFKLGEADSDSSWLTVVGIAADVRHQGLEQSSGPTFYVPFAQSPTRMMTVVLRGKAPETVLGAALRESVLALSPQQPAYRVEPVSAFVDAALARPRFQTGAVSGFAVLALVLAAVGAYGVVAHSVTQRRRDLGIGIALGARARDLAKLAFGQELALVAAGIGLGLVLSLVAGRVLASSRFAGLLYQVSAHDPAAMASATLVLLAAAILACWIPWRRARSVDPIQVLRSE